MADQPVDVAETAQLPIDAAPAIAPVEEPMEEPTAATEASAPAAEAIPAADPAPKRDTDTPVAATPVSIESSDHDPLSQKVTLADLCARGTALYAQKNFEAAAEQYGKAAELQAEQNGELNPDNADILFLYGRCVFRLGQERSDVLGGKAPEKKQQKLPASSPAQGKAGSGLINGATSAPPPNQPLGAVSKESQELLDSKKPLFQFTGDENFDDSDEDDEEGEEEEGEEEEEDDLAVAFEVLDLARLLFDKKLAQAQEQETSGDKGKEPSNEESAKEDSPLVRHIKERLADVHDLLGEISLENERYTNAITDARESLKYKKQLYTEDSEILAEAHFKLSLALEFASITTAAGDASDDAAPQQIDQALRDEAVTELEAALKSTQLKLQAKEVELASMASPEENEATRAQIADVQEIIADMEQRLVDLRGPPIDLNNALAANPLGGVLGAAMSASAAETQARIDEAKKSARDVSGLVRKKDKTQAAPAAGSKRKADDDMLAEPKEEKRARTEEPVEEAK
ncbi:hypothetical protein BROUX41_001333 [Berkeleyomyces rouxiae]|uniref:uncharacterized protein n=1 Tax=Berkeleyomyces rouxiae TaxID=2035830 RepID=UPI003B7B1636